MNKIQLGWTAFFEAQLALLPTEILPAKVLALEATWYHLAIPDGDADGALVIHHAQLSGHYLGHREFHTDLPVPGDWVGVKAGPHGAHTIVSKFDRWNHFSRKNSGTVQTLASNLDGLLVMTALDQDFSYRRIERFLVQARAGGVSPIVLFSKADLDPDYPQKVQQFRSWEPQVPTVAISSLNRWGLEELGALLKPWGTYALVGSSGVGKSTLINAWMGQTLQRTQEIRSQDGKGRHTTTSRRFFALPQGAWLMDSPGIRALEVSTEEDSVNQSFADVEALISQCRFADCHHQAEPGCAIQEGLTRGTLAEERWRSWQKLQKEIAYVDRQGNRMEELKEKQKWKSIRLQQKAMSKHHKHKRGY